MSPEIQEWSHISRSRIHNLYLLTRPIGLKGTVVGWTRASMSGRQIHHSYVVASLLPHPAGGRHIPAGREGLSDLVQHVRSAPVPPFRSGVRQRGQHHAQGYVSARKYTHDPRPDLSYVLDIG